MTECVKCNGKKFECDPVTGENCCINCGTVSSVANLVAEVEFIESGSTSRAVGKFVGSCDDPNAQDLKPSQEISVNRVRDYMLNIANQISLTSEFVESALSFYRMALHRNLTRARKTENVAVACLYMCCRIEKTSHLLVDFTEIVKLDIFTLGKTFLFLTRALSIHLPIVDPCLYIQRFGHKLNLGEKTHMICVTAVQLVSRMKRDWIHHGRRPAGLCGAAILVAARLHGVKKTVKQIVRVVRISSAILLKRLKDFSNTQTALLTIDEFKDMDLSAEGTEADPPSYVKSLEQAERYKKLEKENNWLNSDILHQVSKTQTEIEVYMGIRQAIEVGIEETHRTGKFYLKNTKKSIKKKKQSQSSKYYHMNLKSKDSDDSIEYDQKNIETYNCTKINEIDCLNGENSDEIFSSIEKQFSLIFSKDNNTNNTNNGVSENIDEQICESEIDKLALIYPLKNINNNINEDNKPSNIFNQNQKYYPMIPDNEEINSDFDDFEINNCLLTPAESLYKQQMWEKENEEYIQERERKKKEKLQHEKNKKRRKRLSSSLDRSTNSNENKSNFKSKQDLNMEIVKHIVENEGTTNTEHTLSNSTTTSSLEIKCTNSCDSVQHLENNLNSLKKMGNIIENSTLIDKILKTGKHGKRKAKVNLTKALRNSNKYVSDNTKKS